MNRASWTLSLLVCCLMVYSVRAHREDEPQWKTIYSNEQAEWLEYVNGFAVTAIAQVRPASAVGDRLLSATSFTKQDPKTFYELSYSGSDETGLSFQLAEVGVSRAAVASYHSMMGLNPNLVTARDFASTFYRSEAIGTAPARPIRTALPPTELQLNIGDAPLRLIIRRAGTVIVPTVKID